MVLAAAAIFSFKGVLAKLVYAEGVGVPALLAVRFALSVPLTWAIALGLGMAKRPPTGRELLAIAIGGSLGYGAAPIADFIALELIAVSVERVLLFTFPAFVVLFDALWQRRPPTGRQWAALGTTQIGIVFVVGGFNVAEVLRNLEGAAWAVLSAALFAIYLMVNQTYGRTLGALRFTALAMTSGGAAIFVYFLAAAPISTLVMTPLAYLYLAVMTVFSTVVPMFMMTEGIKRIGAARAALISTIGPPWTVVLAAIILGETLTLMQGLGGAIVILGVLVLESRVRWPFARRAT
ncbi:MAG: DMT family transporter [Alphaproteobacteria bacterium]|nr:DMT family transporter [Alphaproteobacteria bacterium]